MRITKVITKTGDNGMTGLSDGSRVPKSSLRINAIGEVDELNVCIGSFLALEDFVAVGSRVFDSVQHTLFDLGGELSSPSKAILDQEDVDRLTEQSELLNKYLPPLKNFVLPRGDETIIRLHVARVVCRRAERSVVALGDKEYVNKFTIQYLNRLSDYLFVMIRHIHHQFGEFSEVLWQPKTRRK